jgi:hypothetical protein
MVCFMLMVSLFAVFDKPHENLNKNKPPTKSYKQALTQIFNKLMDIWEYSISTFTKVSQNSQPIYQK